MSTLREQTGTPPPARRYPDHAEQQARQTFILVTIGKQGVGKSYQNKITIEQTVRGNLARRIPPRRALVIDTNDEYTYLKAIHVRDVQLFSASRIIEARRIRPLKDNGQPMSISDLQRVLATVLEYYRNGLLVIEDMSRFVSDTMKQDLIGSLVNVRHKNIDVVISLQGLGRITPKLWQNLRWLRMHKITEAIAKHSTKYEEKEKYLTIAENIINKKFFMGDERIFLNIDCHYGKIYGRYTQRDFVEACIEYIDTNRRRELDPLLLQRNLGSGALKFNEQSAYQYLIEQYSQEFSQYSSK